MTELQQDTAAGQQMALEAEIETRLAQVSEEMEGLVTEDTSPYTTAVVYALAAELGRGEPVANDRGCDPGRSAMLIAERVLERIILALEEQRHE